MLQDFVERFAFIGRDEFSGRFVRVAQFEASQRKRSLALVGEANLIDEIISARAGEGGGRHRYAHFNQWFGRPTCGRRRGDDRKHNKQGSAELFHEALYKRRGIRVADVSKRQDLAVLDAQIALSL